VRLAAVLDERHAAAGGQRLERGDVGRLPVEVQVLEAETRAFWEKDFEAFAACWVDADYVRRAGWWARGGITWRRGWAEMAERTRAQFAENPEANNSATEVRRENLVVRVGADIAWVTFDQYAPDAGEPDMDMPGLSHETRILERHGGRWKLAYMSYLLEPTGP
jgi:hypothetical protein